MKIAESHVVMASDRQYTQVGTKNEKRAEQGDAFQKIVGSSYQVSAHGTGGNNSGMWLNYGGNGIHIFSTGTYTRLRSSTPDQLQNVLLKRLIRRMMEGGLFAKTAGFTITKNGVTFSFVADSVPLDTDQRQMSYTEQEDTSFQALGRAKTEDGRTLDFNIDILMSRQYMEYMDVSVPVIENALIDPLVINVGAGVAELSDQTFRFDLDADGTEEEISTLGKGSGFLALDKNGDGRINDGNELFGTKTGDGFSELRRYDSDGNGWIDENDEVFYRLKVWCKGKNGEDILMNLKEADVGAIFLGEQKTQFSLTKDSGEKKGVIRSTGIFLKESGGVGTVQHVDFAKGKGGNQLEYRNL